MEKLLTILAALLMVFSFSVVGMAAEPNVVGYAYLPDTIGTTGTSHQLTMNRQATCGPGEIYTGEVAWVDPADSRIMVSGQDGSKIFDVSEAALQSMPEVNNFVDVKYTVMNGERLASSVTAIPERVASLYENYAYAGPY